MGAVELYISNDAFLHDIILEFSIRPENNVSAKYIYLLVRLN